MNYKDNLEYLLNNGYELTRQELRDLVDLKEITEEPQIKTKKNIRTKSINILEIGGVL